MSDLGEERKETDDTKVAERVTSVPAGVAVSFWANAQVTARVCCGSERANCVHPPVHSQSPCPYFITAGRRARGKASESGTRRTNT